MSLKPSTSYSSKSYKPSVHSGSPVAASPRAPSYSSKSYKPTYAGPPSYSSKSNKPTGSPQSGSPTRPGGTSVGYDMNTIVHSEHLKLTTLFASESC